MPNSKPSDQPDKIPQPLNAPHKDRPFIPITKVTNPEIAFKDDPAVVVVPPPAAGGNGKNPPANKNNNKQKKRKQKKDWGSGSDSEYTDPYNVGNVNMECGISNENKRHIKVT